MVLFKEAPYWGFFITECYIILVWKNLKCKITWKVIYLKKIYSFYLQIL